MRFKKYADIFQNEYIPYVNQCISDIVTGQMHSFYETLKRISEFQLSHFESMIPKSFTNIWKMGIESDKFLLKLCGSGGGGFLLGFTTDYSDTKKFFKKLHHEVIPVYKSGL